jgi:hypothetical protein
MAEVQRRHPNLSVLNTEAAGAALMLEAKMVVGPPTANGQLASVHPVEGICFRTVDLPEVDVPGSSQMKFGDRSIERWLVRLPASFWLCPL